MPVNELLDIVVATLVAKIQDWLRMRGDFRNFVALSVRMLQNICILGICNGLRHRGNVVRNKSF